MRHILKQTSYIFLAQIFGRVIGFFYTIFLARNLGVSDFGLYSAALAYFSLVSAVADFGFNRFLIREVARDHQKIPQLISNVSLLRLALTSSLFAVFAVGLYLLDPDKIRVSITLLAVMAVLPQSISLTFDAIFVAIRKLQYSSLALVVLNLTTASFGVFLIRADFNITGAVVALIIGQLVYAVFLVILSASQKLKLLAQVNWATIKHILSGSLPYGLLGILSLLYFRIDILILAYLKGNFDAGIYGASYKFLEAVVFVPAGLATALFPVLAKLHDQNPPASRLSSTQARGEPAISKLYFRSIKLMFLAGVLVMAGYLTVLPFVIKFFLPNYSSSIEVVKILSLAIPFIFIHVPGAQVLLSTDKYLKPVMLLSVLTLSFNIILNFAFIPKFGFIGASWVTVASEVLSFLVFFQLLKIKVLK